MVCAAFFLFSFFFLSSFLSSGLEYKIILAALRVPQAVTWLTVYRLASNWGLESDIYQNPNVGLSLE